MKRLRADETVKELIGSQLLTTNNPYNSNNNNQVLSSNVTINNSCYQTIPITNNLSATISGGIKIVNNSDTIIGKMQSGLYPPATPVNYGTMPTASSTTTTTSTTIKTQQQQQMQQLSGNGSNQLRIQQVNSGTSPTTTTTNVQSQQDIQQLTPQQQQQQQQQQQSPGSNFQRLKVEDALSYLDLVKFKFGSKPQVYNDFLDIMKDFKSQSIDTPGVIQRVSNLFKGFPELISGFNTFLPPGYKIEVQRSEQGYAFQVSVSMPSPNSGGNLTSDSQQQKSAMIMRGSGTINISGGGGCGGSSGVGGGDGGGGSNQSLSVQQQLIPPLPLVPPPQTQQQQQQQHQTMSSITSSSPSTHIQQSVISQQVTTPTIVPIVHHSSGGSVGGGYGNNNVGNNNTSNSNNNTKNNSGGIIGTNFNNNALSLSAAQVAVSQALQGHNNNNNNDSPQNQPVQFNHAINYVNKIKNRFQDQPEKYKKFLDILHIYQKDQRTIKETSGGPIGGCGVVGGGGGGIVGGKHLTEQEVYSQVAKLFENQSDLLAEFGQFLPDATSHINPTTNQINSNIIGGNINNNSGGIIGNSNIGNLASSIGGQITGSSLNDLHHHVQHHHSVVVKKPQIKQSYNRDNLMERHIITTHKPGHVTGQIKRSPPYPAMMHRDAPLQKKHKMSSCRDVTLAEAGKYGTLNDYAFFDKVRKAVRTQEVYNNFLRCLTLFNQEVISKSELIMVVTPFLGKFPELMRWFREFLGQNDLETIPYNVVRSERPQGELQLEIDLTTAKRLGASYCVIPAAQEGLTCSGRTQLCKEVLNDQWVSFPTWSEDSTFVSSRKTQYEEYMYRCEDERFELDVVIETNASTIRVLEGVQKKLSRMSSDEVARYRLDDCLGGQSPTLHQRALKRIYGDKAQDIIDGLKRNPAVAVPVVLRRLKAKEEEWREAQKGFNKIWREQNEKYYLKSLDHQGINFKQIDVKALRSKSLFNEIETIFDERHEQNEDNSAAAAAAAATTTTTTSINNDLISGPHLILPYKDRSILDDAANLLIHHVKRQTGIQKGEKRRIKHLLRQFLPELFFHPKQQLTDDEKEDDDDKEDGDESPGSSPNINRKKKEPSPGKLSPTSTTTITTNLMECENIEIKMEPDLKDDTKIPVHAQSNDPDEAYTLFMANNNWYIFLRLHAILCERLAKIYERAVVLAADEAKLRTNRKESTAVALRLKPKPQIEIEDYYPAFLDMVKNLLDGNMDSNTYEDTLREMFGIHAYIAFTLDKVVSYGVRQLQYCVTERTANACTELFLKEQKRCGTGGSCNTAYKRQHLEMAYQRTAEKVVQDENCFKIYIYKKDCRMTIELLDTDTDDTKKIDETNKWNSYKERFVNCTNTENVLTTSSMKQRSPVYLNRNLRIYKKRMLLQHHHNNKKNSRNNNNNNNSSNNSNQNEQKDDKISPDSSSSSTITTNETTNKNNNDNNEKNYGIIEELERKLNERQLPERNVTEHPGYVVSDEQQCKFNSQDSKIVFTVNKDSYLYKISAFFKARKSHPEITKRLSSRFRQWLKRWISANVSDIQHKQCTDWLMGRGDGVVPNRTRVLTDNDLTRTPYISYNRYRVERLNIDDNAT